MSALACTVATWTARIMGHALTVLVLTAVTLGCVLWSVAADNALAANVALSVAALDITAAVLFVSDRDTQQILRALAALVIASDADDSAAPTLATDNLERRMG